MGETMIDNSDVNQAELDSGSERAAIKIQATYRGFKTRKELHQQKGIKINAADFCCHDYGN